MRYHDMKLNILVDDKMYWHSKHLLRKTKPC